MLLQLLLRDRDAQEEVVSQVLEIYLLAEDTCYLPLLNAVQTDPNVIVLLGNNL